METCTGAGFKTQVFSLSDESPNQWAAAFLMNVPLAAGQGTYFGRSRLKLS